MIKSFKETGLRFLTILLAGMLFLSDLLIPAFNTGGILFQSLFILSLWIPNRHNNMLLASMCTLFIVLGYGWRHGFYIDTYDLFSRSLSILGIWSIAIVVSKRKELIEHVSYRESRIKSLIEEKTSDDRNLYNKQIFSLKNRLTALTQEAERLSVTSSERELKQLQAERSSDAKSRFMVELSETLKVPIKDVMDAAQQLQQSSLDNAQRSHLFTIFSAGESMFSLSNDLIDYTQIEAGEYKIKLSSFIFRTTIEDAFSAVMNRASSANIELSYNLDPSIPVTVDSDPLGLKQTLKNIINHAIQRSKPGEVVLSAKLLEKTSENHLIYFSITDNGPTVSPTKFDQLWKSAIDSGLTGNEIPENGEPIEKSELGLIVAGRLCTMLGGKIWAEEAKSGGMMFQCVIPVQKAKKQDVPLQGKPWFIGKHVLVVEQSENVRRFLNHQLKNWGMQTTILTSGPEALKWYAAGHISDIALINMDLPVLDGLTLAHQIKQNNRELPILLMTNDRRSIIASVVTATVPKPLFQKRLYDEINAILSLKSESTRDIVS